MKLTNMASISIRLILVGVVICSLIYPMLVGGIGQIWGNASRGSLMKYEGEIVGSRLIGQEFSAPRYFHSRPSSINYDASQSGSANLGSNNQQLKDRVRRELEKLARQNNIKADQVPADLVTESGSALDPHISPEAAFFQVPRIAEATGISPEKLNQIVEERIESRLLGVFGKERVNVLQLNLDIKEVLDQ